MGSANSKKLGPLSQADWSSAAPSSLALSSSPQRILLLSRLKAEVKPADTSLVPHLGMCSSALKVSSPKGNERIHWKRAPANTVCNEKRENSQVPSNRAEQMESQDDGLSADSHRIGSGVPLHKPEIHLLVHTGWRRAHQVAPSQSF